MSKKKTHPLAISSLVLGLVFLVLLMTKMVIGYSYRITGLVMLTSISAIVTGHIAFGRIRKSAGEFHGKPFAVVGFLLGYPEWEEAVCRNDADERRPAISHRSRRETDQRAHNSE